MCNYTMHAADLQDHNMGVIIRVNYGMERERERNFSARAKLRSLSGMSGVQTVLCQEVEYFVLRPHSIGRTSWQLVSN
jgi:single-stranded DNA-specific DHH superfamily exonuclease